MAHIALHLKEKSINEKIDLSSNISVQVAAHAADFLGYAPVIEALDMARDLLVARGAGVLAAESQLALARSQEEEADRAHDLQLDVTAAFAEQVTKYDGSKMEGGGFPLAKLPAPVGALSAPANLRARLGAFPGTTDLECEPVHGAVSYVAECATVATGPFTRIYEGTRTKFIATGMDSGGLYYFRMKAIGAAGSSPWSDITEKRAA